MNEYIMKKFRFLVDRYKMEFLHQIFEKDVTEKFYGPMNAYSYYNNNGCFTIYHAVQRNELYFYYSKEISDIQVNLLYTEININDIICNKNIFISNRNILDLLSNYIKEQIETKGNFFNISVK
ncbi:MAG: hypothetical protein A2Y17_11545 [Clostridiales bacterium GWF2_38_85]|nr:MAG: hypothetical protein A2Y17_11545 [Clostridiales bacterium GWF2_38_85]HBL85195.1 hypothetical protein [Clostridiales bacterium]